MYSGTAICVVILLYSSLGNAEDCENSATPPDPNSGCCGRAVGIDKIILSAGVYAQLSEYPWMGFIEYQKGNKTKLQCSGFLISGRYMLSAAQCFGSRALESGKPNIVRVGEYDTSHDGPDCVDVGGFQECSEGALKIPIEKVITHPEYNARSRQHDIALIRLGKAVPFTDFTKPICLPTSDITVEGPQHRMWVAGWSGLNHTSLSKRLHHVDLPYVDLDTCRSAFNNKVKLGDEQMCAGGELGKDSCQGDSGGPLMYTRDYTTEAVGIVSFGSARCGKEGIPSVYTKVFSSMLGFGQILSINKLYIFLM